MFGATRLLGYVLLVAALPRHRPCLHFDPKSPDYSPGETARLRGESYFLQETGHQGRASPDRADGLASGRR